MAFTDHCDIFASFHEDAFNRIVHHIRRQRPSLFNYGTAAVARNRALWCHVIDAHPIVFARNNPLMTIVDPLPVPGTPYGVNFAVQLAELRLDFHPGNQFSLPPELGPALAAQRLAIKLRLCAGIGCPPKEVVDDLIPVPEDRPKPGAGKPNEPERPPQKPPLIPLPTRQLICFCLDAFVTGGVHIADYNGKPYLEPFLDGFEIVDIQPAALEAGLECYISLMLRLAVLPGLRILLKHAPLNLTQGATDLFPQPTNVSLSAVPVSAAVPHNPAIEQNEIKTFIKAEVI
jgi:hypothetical protein